MNEPRDELLERYADAVAQDSRRPSTRVRAAALAHAQMLRDQANKVQQVKGDPSTAPAANQPQWTFSLVASLAVVGLVGLLYIQIDRGPVEDREVVLGIPAPRGVPSSPDHAPVARVDTAQASPPERTAPAMEGRQRPSKDTLLAKPIASPPTAAAAAAKTDVIAAHREKSPALPPVALQDSEQAIVNATNTRAALVLPAEGDAETKMASTAPDEVTSAGAIRDAKSTANAEAAARKTTSRFLQAVRNGRVETVQELLAQGVPINARDGQGNTALMLAVHHRRVLVVRKLLEMGADTSMVNSDGLTALQLANQLHFAEMVQLLEAPR